MAYKHYCELGDTHAHVPHVVDISNGKLNIYL